MKEYAKKITTAVMGISPEIAEKAVKDGQRVSVLRVYGFSKSYKDEQSAFGGMFKRFSGEFEAVNLHDGHAVRSEQLILPPVAEMYVSDGTEAAMKGEGKFKFALDLMVEPNTSKKGGQKFKYAVSTLIEADNASDPLTELGESLPIALPDASKPDASKKRK